MNLKIKGKQWTKNISQHATMEHLRYRQLNFKNVGETRGATHYSLGRVWAVKKKKVLVHFIGEMLMGLQVPGILPWMCL